MGFSRNEHHFTVLHRTAHSKTSSLYIQVTCTARRSRWPYDLRRRSGAARLLGSRVRIPLRPRMFVSCVCSVCCVVLCRQRPVISLSEESYWVFVSVCDLDTSNRRPGPALGCCATEQALPGDNCSSRTSCP